MTALQALLGFTAWTVMLVATVFLYRSVRFLRGSKLNSWPRSVRNPGDADFIQRVADAHANCIENLVVFAALVLVAGLSNRLEAIAVFATLVFYARIGQSLVHLTGTSSPQVFVRAGLWASQVVLFVLMGLKLYP